jgi:hypothetical protein
MLNRIEDRRSRNVVYKDLQSKIIMQVSWPMAFVMIITTVILIMLGMHLKSEAAKLDTELAGFMPLVVSTVILFSFAVISQILIALIVSHRVAGPVYRIIETLRAFQNGDSKNRAHLREGDLHTRLAAEVNSFLDWVEEREACESVPDEKASKHERQRQAVPPSQAGV